MDIKGLKEYKNYLEKRSKEIEDILFGDDVSDEDRTRLEDIEDKIDEQLDLLDEVLIGIEEIPRKYNELIKLRDSFKNIDF